MLCALLLQSSAVWLQVVLGLSSQTGITSPDCSQAVIGIKVDDVADVSIKLQENN
jgi:hypothetical protein